jgi:hypothetical protein
MKKLGIINGEVKEITANEKGTHFYVDGKRISKSVALEAIKAYEEKQKAEVATDIADNVVENKENVQETQEKVSVEDDEIGKNLPEMVLTLDELRSVVNSILDIAKTKSVKEKIEKYNKNALVQWFVKNFIRNQYRIGAYYKRFVKDAEIFGIEPVKTKEISLYKLYKVVNELTNKGTIKKVVLSKDEFSKLASVIPMMDADLGESFFKILNGRVKLGIPSKYL